MRGAEKGAERWQKRDRLVGEAAGCGEEGLKGACC